MNSEIRVAEVVTALKRIRKGRSSDANGLQAEPLMHGGEGLVLYLTRLFQVVWRSAVVPKDWQEMPLTPVYKNTGSRSDPNNYRMLCAGSIVGKVFEAVLLNRLSANGFAEYLMPEQIGFRPGFGIDDHIFTLLSLIKLNVGATFVAFIDLREAYDSVWRAGIRGRMFAAIRAMYASVEADVTISPPRQKCGYYRHYEGSH